MPGWCTLLATLRQDKVTTTTMGRRARELVAWLRSALFPNDVRLLDALCDSGQLSAGSVGAGESCFSIARTPVPGVPGQHVCLPRLLGIGFPKCGTTAFYGALGNLPGFVASRTKEVGYFLRFKKAPHLDARLANATGSWRAFRQAAGIAAERPILLRDYYAQWGDPGDPTEAPLPRSSGGGGGGSGTAPPLTVRFEFSQYARFSPRAGAGPSPSFGMSHAAWAVLPASTLVVALVREPVSRALSHYGFFHWRDTSRQYPLRADTSLRAWLCVEALADEFEPAEHEAGSGRPPQSRSAAAAARRFEPPGTHGGLLGGGRYAELLDRWRLDGKQTLSRRMVVYLREHLSARPGQVLASVGAELGLSKAWQQAVAATEPPPRASTNSSAHFAALLREAPAALVWLADYYAPHNARLARDYNLGREIWAFWKPITDGELLQRVPPAVSALSRGTQVRPGGRGPGGDEDDQLLAEACPAQLVARLCDGSVLRAHSRCAART